MKYHYSRATKNSPEFLSSDCLISKSVATHISAATPYYHVLFEDFLRGINYTMFRTKSTKRHFEQKNDAQKLFSNKKAQKRHFRQKSILRNVVRANGHRQNLQPRNVLFFTNSVIAN